MMPVQVLAAQLGQISADDDPCKEAGDANSPYGSWRMLILEDADL